MGNREEILSKLGINSQGDGYSEYICDLIVLYYMRGYNDALAYVNETFWSDKDEDMQDL